MNDAQVLMVGGLVSAIGGMLFLATWFVMAMFPSKVLLGGVEGLWLDIFQNIGNFFLNRTLRVSEAATHVCAKLLE